MKQDINRYEVLEKITPLIENTAMRFNLIPIEIEFVKYAQYAELLTKVKEAVDKQKLEYGIEYGERKGFKTYKITDVFESSK